MAPSSALLSASLCEPTAGRWSVLLKVTPSLICKELLYFFRLYCKIKIFRHTRKSVINQQDPYPISQYTPKPLSVFLKMYFPVSPLPALSCQRAGSSIRGKGGHPGAEVGGAGVCSLLPRPPTAALPAPSSRPAGSARHQTLSVPGLWRSPCDCFRSWSQRRWCRLTSSDRE